MSQRFTTHRTLIDDDGYDIHLSPNQRRRFLAALSHAPLPNRLLGKVLIGTGIRPIEIARVFPHHIRHEQCELRIESAKKRQRKTPRRDYRDVPLPKALLPALIRYVEQSPTQPLWPWSRWTVLRHMKPVFVAANIHTPINTVRALRHTFAVDAKLKGYQLDEIRAWLGHAYIDTTAIYTQVKGPEARARAQRLWDGEDDLWA